MKSLLKFLLLISLIYSSSSNAQWKWQSPRFTGNLLSSIKCVNSNLLFAVGNGSTVLRSKDVGDSWESLPIEKCGYIYDVDSYTDNTIVASGAGGLFLKSTDAGNTWTKTIIAAATDFKALTMVNQNLILAVGTSKIVRSTNGGTNWSVPVTPTLPDLSDVAYLNNNVIFAVGQSIFKSADGGQSFNKITIPFTDNFNSISIPSSSAIYVSSATGLYKTTNGGANWTNPFVYSFAASKISFTSNDIGYVIGSSGQVMKTIDGGANWSSLPGPAPISLSGLAISSLGDVLVSGSSGAMYKYNGSYWKNLNPGWTNYISSISFTNNQVGLACGADGLILKTANSGADWVIKSSEVAGWLKTILMVSPKKVFAFGASAVHSLDGGETWQILTLPTTSMIYSMCFVDTVTGYAVGESGTIINTTDGGNIWFSKNSGVSSELRGIAFINSSTGVAVGKNMVLKSNDGGETWVKKLDASGALYAVSFKDNLTGLAVGGAIDFPLVYKTTDAGETWTLLSNPPTMGLLTVKYSSKNLVYAGGYNGSLVKSTDDGQSWTVSSYYQTANIESISAVNDSMVWACGNAMIISSSVKSSTPVSTEKQLIQTFQLSNAYPNPFNPVTRIEYKIDVPGFVSINVFDAFGRKISELLNENKNKGNYFVDFDGKGLSSGVYFYTLTSGSRMESRKIVLLK